jgi:hypothetical protein
VRGGTVPGRTGCEPDWPGRRGACGFGRTPCDGAPGRGGTDCPAGTWGVAGRATGTGGRCGTAPGVAEAVGGAAAEGCCEGVAAGLAGTAGAVAGAACEGDVAIDGAAEPAGAETGADGRGATPDGGGAIGRVPAPVPCCDEVAGPGVPGAVCGTVRGTGGDGGLAGTAPGTADAGEAGGRGAGALGAVAGFGDAAAGAAGSSSEPPANFLRTFSATSTGMELEWVFFSVTP